MTTRLTRRIHELAIQRKGWAEYIYFARIGGKWVDLAPYGNRIPKASEVAQRIRSDIERAKQQSV